MSFSSKYVTIKFALVACLFSSVQLCAHDSWMTLQSQALCYQDELNGKMKYLEYQFVIKPANMLKQASNSALALMTVAYTAIAASMVIHNSTVTNKNQEINLDVPKGLLAAGLSKLGYDYYMTCMETTVKMKVMKEFLQNWDLHQNYVPDEFKMAFNELAEKYEYGATLTNTQVLELYDIALQLVEHAFEKRYPRKEAKDEGLLSSVKTIKEISSVK